MCGIFASTKTNKEFEQNCQQLLRRRGPDSGDIIHIDGICLGHRRLSIIDVGFGGNQPFSDDSGKVHLVFNGEIYNYKELRAELKISNSVRFRSNSDTEVLLNLYMHQGIRETLRKIRGMFAFCIYNGITKNLIFARDHFGIKPLYIALIDSELYLSSDPRTLNCIGTSKELSRKALNDLLLYGSVQQPSVIFSGIESIKPGEWGIYDVESKRLNIKSYVDLTPFTIRQYSHATVREELDYLLKQATERVIASDVPVGLFLSAGLDSTIVGKLLSEEQACNISSFTLGFEGKYGSYLGEQNEIKDAKKSAIAMGMKHYGHVVKDSDISDLYGEYIKSLHQPSADGFNTFLISYFSSKYVRVAVTGQGADELFCGYSHFESLARPSVHRGLSSLLKQLVTRNVRHPFIMKKLLTKLEPLDSLYVARHIGFRHAEYTDMRQTLPEGIMLENYSLEQQFSLIEVYSYMSNTLNRDSDAVSMYNSMELRPFYQDYDLFTFALSLPLELKRNKEGGKLILKELFRQRLPFYDFGRAKTGFELPIAKWMNNELRDRLISESKMLKEIDIPAEIANEYIDCLEKARCKRRHWALATLASFITT